VLGVLPFLLVILSTPEPWGPLAAIYLFHVLIILGWCALYVGYHYLRDAREAEAEKWRLALAVQESELRSLRAQLNPHFLFNSLNSLRAMIPEDPERAQEAVTELAALMRYTLQVSRGGATTLERELEVTRQYLELEAMRFEARLRYAIDVEPAALSHLLPPLLLQTLVENAIKHGIARLPEGGKVCIFARRRPDALFLRVTNTGVLRPGPDAASASRGGIGLANSLEQLRLMFGEGAGLELKASGPEEVACEVTIPTHTPTVASPRDRRVWRPSGRKVP
jgi:LytS/YehU family sensor histidine kinase